MKSNIEDRLALVEYILSEITEGNYTEEIKEEFKTWREYADNFINIIPSRDISFKTRSRLDTILDRLELTNQDRRDLEKYIIFGGGENIEYIKNTLEIFLKYKDKLLNIIENAPEEFDTLIEIFDYIEKHIKESNANFEEINANILSINEEVNKKLNIEDSPFEKGSGINSAVLKGGGNKASGHNSIAIGRETNASGVYSYSQGYNNKANSNYSHSEGRDNISNGLAAHSEGRTTVASGDYSHAEGGATITTNPYEHGEGRYNRSNKDITIHSVGVGTSNEDRKNAHEITKYGKHYILDIGGYDGTNPSEAEDVASVINKIENKLNDIQTLYLSLGSSMTKEECLDIVKKLDAIDKNKFYTINIYDKVETYNYGSCELISIKDSYYRLIQNVITSTGNVQRYIYTLHFDGTYERQKTTYGSLTNILERLNTIEEKLNEITTE